MFALSIPQLESTVKGPTRAHLGFCIFLGLALWQYTSQQEANLFFSLFVAFRFVIVALIYLVREDAKHQSVVNQQIVAWISSILPFFYSTNRSTLWYVPIDLSAVMFFGSSLSFWGIISLGKSFSITPAKRTIVRDGPFRYIKHPIYVGYFISEAIIVFSFPSLLNLLLFSLTVFLYIKRSKWEEIVLSKK